jgi:hypothetical protein
MSRRLPARLAAALLCLFMLCGAPAHAAPCVAAVAMKDGAQALDQRKDLLQRREWLYLEYLTSDGSKKSRKRLEQEVANSQVRTAGMIEQLEALKALPADTPEIPEEGTPACETVTRVKAAIDGVLDVREKELAEVTAKTFPFLKACDEIGVQLVNLAASARKPDVTERQFALFKVTMDVMLGPQIHRARMDPADFGRLVDEVFAADNLSPRKVAAYGALRCLRGHQRARIKSLPESTPALTQCPTASWTELGLCLGPATQP